MAGINRRMRDTDLWQGSMASLIRDFRRRSLPTKHGHARLCPSTPRVIREYQSDSLSKRPASSLLLGFGLPNPSQRKNE